jgi:hypothetical protein
MLPEDMLPEGLILPLLFGAATGAVGITGGGSCNGTGGGATGRGTGCGTGGTTVGT